MNSRKRKATESEEIETDESHENGHSNESEDQVSRKDDFSSKEKKLKFVDFSQLDKDLCLLKLPKEVI